MVRTLIKLRVFLLLPMVILILSGCDQLPTSHTEHRKDVYDSENLPFSISIDKEIDSDGIMTFQKNDIGIINKSDGSHCLIHQLHPSDVVKTLLYINPKTIRIIWDKNIMPYYSSEDWETSTDLKTAFTSEGIDLGFVFRHYEKDANGHIIESTKTDINDKTSEINTIIDNDTVRFVHDKDLRNYQYLIAIEERKDFIWIYDADGRIVYRSPKLQKFHEEEPCLARSYGKKVL